jgi:hypothetical protein
MLFVLIEEIKLLELISKDLEAVTASSIFSC